MGAQELAELRDHEIARRAHRHVDTQPAAQRSAGRLEHRLQLVDVGEQVFAALVERLAVLGDLHAARRPVVAAEPAIARKNLRPRIRAQVLGSAQSLYAPGPISTRC